MFCKHYILKCSACQSKTTHSTMGYLEFDLKTSQQGLVEDVRTRIRENEEYIYVPSF